MSLTAAIYNEILRLKFKLLDTSATFGNGSDGIGNVVAPYIQTTYLKQYTNLTISSSYTSSKPLMIILVQGTLTVTSTGSISMAGRGGTGGGPDTDGTSGKGDVSKVPWIISPPSITLANAGVGGAYTDNFYSKFANMKAQLGADLNRPAAWLLDTLLYGGGGGGGGFSIAGSGGAGVGSGGSGGLNNVNPGPAAGGNGGGMVLIVARTMVFASGSNLSVNGVSGLVSNAGGGGGGGGCAIIRPGTLTDNGLVATASGGAGGNGGGFFGGTGGAVTTYNLATYGWNADPISGVDGTGAGGGSGASGLLLKIPVI